MHKIEEYAMKHEQHIHNNKEVVWIPECIESSKPVKRLRKLHEASTEPAGCKCEGNSHANHHQNSSHTFHSMDKIDVPGLHFPKVNPQRRVLTRRWWYQPWEVTGKVVSNMENDRNNNGSRNCLQTTSPRKRVKRQVALNIRCSLQYTELSL